MGRQDYETETLVAHTLRGKGFDAGEDGTGRGTPLVPVGVFQDSEFGVQQYDSAGTLRAGRIPEHQMVLQLAHAFDARQSDVIQYGDRTGPLDTDGHSVAVAFDTYNQTITGDTTQTLCSRGDTRGGNAHLVPAVQTAMQVRRLTPRECERLQGFPDDYTAIPWRGRPASECPDGPRYKALGNSMAVPVMRYLGERIVAVESER
jgi:DNA (cytosine-5)-methyltransferase 1